MSLTDVRNEGQDSGSKVLVLAHVQENRGAAGIHVSSRGARVQHFDGSYMLWVIFSRYVLSVLSVASPLFRNRFFWEWSMKYDTTYLSLS